MKKIETKIAWPFIGNKPIVDFLKKNIEKEKITHAYCFIGPKQVGKRTLANIFSKAIFCHNLASLSSGLSCKKCSICEQFDKGIHSDFIVLSKEKDKKNISIEAVRTFQHRLNTTSLLGNIKIGLIDEAADLSEEGSNALLKTLEEPPSKSIIILMTASADSLPTTIISRCQKFVFQLVSRQEIVSYLEQMNCSKQKAEKLAALSLGRPGRAIDFLKHPPLLQRYEEIQDDFLKIFNKNITDRFSLAQRYLNLKFYQERVNQAEEIINIWLSLIRDLILVKENRWNEITHLDRTKILERIAKINSRKDLLENINQLLNFQKVLDKNVNPQLALENYFLNIKSYA